MVLGEGFLGLQNRYNVFRSVEKEYCEDSPCQHAKHHAFIKEGVFGVSCNFVAGDDVIVVKEDHVECKWECQNEVFVV